jgi:glutamine amidotransferase-like uncharacterized protein
MRHCFKKNSSQKRAGGVAKGVHPEFKPHMVKKKRNNEWQSLERNLFQE